MVIQSTHDISFPTDNLHFTQNHAVHFTNFSRHGKKTGPFSFSLRPATLPAIVSFPMDQMRPSTCSRDRNLPTLQPRRACRRPQAAHAASDSLRRPKRKLLVERLYTKQLQKLLAMASHVVRKDTGALYATRALSNTKYATYGSHRA